MFIELYWSWRLARLKAAAKRAERRSEAEAERVARQAYFESFVNQTKPLVPRAPVHQKAALFRHVWKRAHVLKAMCEFNAQELSAEEATDMVELAKTWSDVANRAAQQYYACAPETLY